MGGSAVVEDFEDSSEMLDGEVKVDVMKIAIINGGGRIVSLYIHASAGVRAHPSRAREDRKSVV